MNQLLLNHIWYRIVTLVALLIGLSSLPLMAAESDEAATEKITRHQYSNPQTGKKTPYLLYHPVRKSAAG
ncbi:MAG: hypothetical protein KDA70_19085, partial [Planctomycetaceae bacterium]|nr:hypothetical protein [Planctomycetaceae bacterium]